MDATTIGNLTLLEEYVDTLISLPHEIQRNLTMIKEHDSQVQDTEKNLFKDIEEFMSLQNKSKESSSTERINLIKRIKDSFLSTLTHSEEKVSLANQCYNSVEKHLIKIEDDLKCFEEEIRLSGYDELLEKVRIERLRQREQIRNKKRREALTGENDNEDEDDEQEEGKEENGSVNEQDEDSEDSETLSEKEQQIQPQQITGKKRKPSNNPRNSNPKRQVGNLRKNDSDDEDQQMNLKVSRAERLLRRNKPNFVIDEAKTGNEPDNLNREDADDEAEDDEEDEDEVEDEEGRNYNEEVDNENIEELENEDNGNEYNGNDIKEDQLNTKSSRSRNSLSSSGDDESIQSDSIRKPETGPSAKGEIEPTYCTCQRVSFGQMIACDGKECRIEWYHIGCVGLKSLPKGKWYCKECQEAMDAKTAAQLANGMSTRSSRRS